MVDKGTRWVFSRNQKHDRWRRSTHLSGSQQTFSFKRMQVTSNWSQLSKRKISLLLSSQENWTQLSNDIQHPTRKLFAFKKCYKSIVKFYMEPRLSYRQIIRIWLNVISSLLIDKFAPNVVYIKGETNVVADNLSRLPLIPLERKQVPNQDGALELLAESLLYFPQDVPVFRLGFENIQAHQLQDLQQGIYTEQEVMKLYSYTVRRMDSKRLYSLRTFKSQPSSGTILWWAMAEQQDCTVHFMSSFSVQNKRQR